MAQGDSGNAGSSYLIHVWIEFWTTHETWSSGRANCRSVSSVWCWQGAPREAEYEVFSPSVLCT